MVDQLHPQEEFKSSDDVKYCCCGDMFSGVNNHAFLSSYQVIAKECERPAEFWLKHHKTPLNFIGAETTGMALSYNNV